MRASIGGMITSAPKDGRAQGRKRARATVGSGKPVSFAASPPPRASRSRATR
jgi:hypothetical protein